MAWKLIDSAPKDGTVVLLWNAQTKTVNIGRWDDSYTHPWHAVVLGENALWNDDDGPNPIFDASHWLPLPDPPKDKSQEAPPARTAPPSHNTET